MDQKLERQAEILASALELQGGERQAYLASACAGDPALQNEIESLLAADAAATHSFLDRAQPVGEILSVLRGQMLAGSTLGSYELEAKLGAGGAGVVYRARDTRTNTNVALKVLPADPALRSRFEREAALAREVEHPGVARLLDAGEAEGYFYVAAELVDGETLRQRLNRGPVPLAEALAIARQLAGALAAIHEKGIVHRDVKPENIMLNAQGLLKLIDFGLAKREQAPSADSTSSSVAGTLGYLAPEQVRGEAATTRSDLFAFGVIFYELLSGQRAFSGATGLETAASILRDQPPPLPGHVPAQAGDLATQCLRKQAARRPTASAAALTLQNITSGTLRRRRSLRWAAAAAAVAVSATLWWNRPAEIRQLYVRPFDEIAQTNAQQPALSWDGQQVAYAALAGPEDGRKIFVIPFTGEQRRQVTFGPEDDSEPTLSPTGDQVAFRSTRSPAGVYLVSTNGGEPKLLAAGGRRPRFSPDGAWIAYETGSWQGSGDPVRTNASAIFRVSAAGGKPARVAADLGIVSGPVWSSDSSELWLLRREKDGAELWRCPFQGAPRRIRPVAVSARLQAFNTGGEIVLSHQGSSLTKLDADGQTLWQTNRQDHFDTYSTSRDGRVVTGSTRRRSELWSLPRQGGLPTALVRSEAIDYLAPWLSADGERLVYRASRDGDAPYGEVLHVPTRTASRLRSIAALAADGQLFESDSPVWDTTGNGQFTPGLTSGRRTILFAGAPILQHPALHLYLANLSPDQRWVAFTGESSGHAPEVFIAPFRGTQPVPPAEWTSAAACDYPRWDRSGALLCLDGLSLVRRSWHPLRRQTGPPVTVTTFSRNSPSPTLLPNGWFRLAVSQDRIVFPLGTITSRVYRAQEISSGSVSRSGPLSLITSSGVSLMKKTLLFLGLLASTSQAAIVYDLKTDFSNSSNPNGAWSFLQGNTLLTHSATPIDGVNNLHLAITNGVWGTAAGFSGDLVFKMTGNSNLVSNYTANDFVAGDVLIDSGNSGTNDTLFIRWTAPQAGTITYSGGVWYAHSSVNRSNDFAVNFNGGAALNSGAITNANNRSNPLNFASAGSISVSAGDVLALRFSLTPGQPFGSINGANFTVNLEPTASGVPEPSTLALTGGALLLAALRLRRK